MKDQLYNFNYSRNRNKLFANLISIIDGIICDGKVNEKELLFLDTWLLDAKEVQNNVIFQQIHDKILDIQFDGEITKEELEEFKQDLICIQKDLLDIPNIDLYSKEADIHLLSGLCKGVIGDGQLNNDEIKYLNWWISQNSLLKNNYPGKELYQLIQNILKDGIISEDERNQLKMMLIDFTGSDPENGIVEGLSIGKSFFDDVENINLSSQTVCFTGKFLLGNREKCKETAEKQGAEVIKDWRSDLDYLIIGTLNSRDWMYQSFGRKIEKVKEHQLNGHPVKIITEEQWIKSFK